jgi:hypothetical protein
MVVVAKGGNKVVSLTGMTPPRMAMVDGGMKRVLCSCRGAWVMGAREYHFGVRAGSAWTVHSARVDRRSIDMKDMVKVVWLGFLISA